MEAGKESAWPSWLSNSSVMLENSQLVCLQPVRILGTLYLVDVVLTLLQFKVGVYLN